MARTAITVENGARYGAKIDPTATTGDSVNDHDLAVGRMPVCLICQNTNAATVDFTIEMPASSPNFDKAASIAHTIPAAAGGVDGIRTIWIDVPDACLETDGKLHIDSADANFGDVRFYAVRGIKTRG